jgi:dihydroflavonol-4-reductase
MKILCVRNYYTNEKAKMDLFIEFNPIDKAITDAIRWFKYNKLLNY